MDVEGVLKHNLSGDGGQGIDGPGILELLHLVQQSGVSADGIAQAKPRCRKEFGNPSENDDIIIVFCQGDGGDFPAVFGKFHIGLVHHDEDALFLAAVQNVSHGLSGNLGGGGVVGIAQHQKVRVRGEGLEKRILVQVESLFLPQAEKVGAAAAQGDFMLIFRVGWPDNQGFFWCYEFDDQGNQFRGAVAHDDVAKVCVDVFADGLSQGSIFPVGIGGDGINVGGQLFPEPEGDSQRVDIGGETDDVLLFDAKMLFYLF